MKKVGVGELRVGMYVDRIEGSWMAHSLWRRRFLISNVGELEATRRSGAKEFWIDIDRSSHLAAGPETVKRTAARDVVAHPDIASPVPSVPPIAEPVSLSEEREEAARICTRARSAVVTLFNDVRAGRPPHIEAMQALVVDIVASATRNSGALIALTRIKTKDDYTFMHSVSVSALMVALARAWGHDEEMCRKLGLGGLLHDIGKALVPLELLNKPGQLTNDEFAVVKRHSAQGHTLLVRAGFTDEVALDVVRHHHEKMDGGGYPDCLSAQRLALSARMGAVCDVYDAVTSARAYKEAWDPAEALTRMASWRGHFDSTVLSTFIKMIGVYPVGSLVRLQSDRLAVVTTSRADALLTPVVKVFYSTKTRMELPVEILDLSHPSVSDRIVAREPRGGWNAAFLEALLQKGMPS